MKTKGKLVILLSAFSILGSGLACENNSDKYYHNKNIPEETNSGTMFRTGTGQAMLQEEKERNEFYKELRKHEVKKIEGRVTDEERKIGYFGQYKDYLFRVESNGKKFLIRAYDDPFLQENFDNNINLGDRITIRYRLPIELLNIDRSNILKIERASN